VAFTAETTDAVSDTGVNTRARWIHSRGVDAITAFSWLPFAVGAMAVSAIAVGAMRWYAMGVLLLSLAHQPITLALVYGDGQKVRSRPRVFLLAPLVLAGVIYVGLEISFILVSTVGGLWNTEHTLMQRYGFTRIYRRKGGAVGAGRDDLALLAGWLALVLAWAVVDPRTPERIERLQLGTANERSLELLVDLRPAAAAIMAVAAAFAVITTARWIRRERATGFAANPAAYLYVGATAALFVVAVIDPIAGLLGWVGAHAVEYFVIVATSLRARRETERSVVSGVDRVIGRRRGVAVLMLTSALIGSLVVLVAELTAGLVLYGMIFFMIGGLHILFDGFIWKLRTPQVAESLAIGD
jgi:hypothetical protein